MKKKEKDRPYCFGKLDNVCPLGQDGLRHSPESCMVCFCKTECLRAAVAGEDGIFLSVFVQQQESGAFRGVARRMQDPEGQLAYSYFLAVDGVQFFKLRFGVRAVHDGCTGFLGQGDHVLEE